MHYGDFRTLYIKARESGEKTLTADELRNSVATLLEQNDKQAHNEIVALLANANMTGLRGLLGKTQKQMMDYLCVPKRTYESWEMSKDRGCSPSMYRMLWVAWITYGDIIENANT